ncbi:MAG: 30S ribosomal protein S6 [Candidatus Aminicenantes bacterium]|nr:30S ribosomal protein S6 [Candidatus Aminicenantes bacterium]
MRLYETAFLIAPNLPEEELESLLKKMQEVVSKKKGKMLNVDNWGKKKMAYSINKFDEATYIFFLYEGTPDIPAELERRFKQTEAIIRFLTVKKDPRDTLRKPGKRAKKKAKETEEKPETETKHDEEEEKEEADIAEESKEEEEKEELEESGNPDAAAEEEPENNKIEEEKE